MKATRSGIWAGSNTYHASDSGYHDRIAPVIGDRQQAWHQINAMGKVIAWKLTVQGERATFEPKNHHTIPASICDVHPLAKVATTINMATDHELADNLMSLSSKVERN
jgi:hypothetical protein